MDKGRSREIRTCDLERVWSMRDGLRGGRWSLDGTCEVVVRCWVERGGWK